VLCLKEIDNFNLNKYYKTINSLILLITLPLWSLFMSSKTLKNRAAERNIIVGVAKLFNRCN